MATKNQMALGPHGMAYHLAEFLHASVWDVNNHFFPQLILICRMAMTVEAILDDEKGKEADREEAAGLVEECSSLLGGYLPLMEENDGAGLRAISQIELIEIERRLLKIIKRNKLVTQQLLASARIQRPGEDAAEEVS